MWHVLRAIVPFFILVGWFLNGGVVAAQSVRVSGFESPGSFKASQVLPANLRSGSGFRVDETVGSDGYLYLFTLHTKYGSYAVTGLDALKEREYELNVLKVLELYTDSKVFKDAAKEAGINIVTAPARVVGEVIEAVSDPKKTMRTFSKVPAGIAGLFSEVYDRAKSGTKSVARAVRGGSSKKEKEKLKGEVVDQGTEIALRYIGYSQKESAWYEKYELDPYTTNRPLREKISRIVTVQSVVNLGFKFVPGIGLGSLSWLSTASSVLDAAETVAVYADPQSQSNKNRAALLEMGVSKDIVEKFLANEVCSPTLKALYVESLKRLTGVSGRETLVALISRVQTADGGEFHLRGVRYLASRHRAGEVLVKIMPGVKIAAAQTKSGTWLTPLPADYVIWSSDFAAATHDLLKTASRLGGRSKVVARLAGKFSPRCRQELTALGVVLQERVPM